MAKRTYDTSTNKSEALREAINIVGMDAENAAVKSWIEDHWSGWVWGSNPAGEIGAARKSIAKKAGVQAPAGRRGRQKSVVLVAKPAAPQPTSEISARAVRAAVMLLNATPDPNAAIDKARRLLSVADNADQVSAFLQEMEK